MAWTYILKCANGAYCTGSTVDLEQRVLTHQQGIGANFTRERLPVRLVWSAEFERIDEAFAWEKRIQGWSRAKKRLLIDGGVEAVAGYSRRARGR